MQKGVPRTSVVRSVFAAVSLAGGDAQGTSGMDSGGLIMGQAVGEVEPGVMGEMEEVGEVGQVEETGERAESTERVVMVELERSTRRCDWASSSPPGYMSARMPLSAGKHIITRDYNRSLFLLIIKKTVDHL